MSLIDKLLDYSIIFSFDTSGFRRHVGDDTSFRKCINEKYLVTGGTSGIGRACVELLKESGAYTTFLGRSEKSAISLFDKNTNFLKLDMSDWEAIAITVEKLPVLNGVVFNAGGMPTELVLNKNKVELQCASQLIGHYKLLNELIKQGKLADNARIVWVSSGGMYLKELDLKNLIKPTEYDKVDVYANVKRAQVTLVEELAKHPKYRSLKLVSMHPGWVGTKGLKEALPKFYNFFKKRLRSARQGADTIVWLLLNSKEPESGAFYFDRKKVSPYISTKYIPSKKSREELLEICNRY